MEEVRGQQTAEGHQMEKDLQEEDLLLDLGVLPEGRMKPCPVRENINDL